MDNDGTDDYSYQAQGLSGEGTATNMLRGITTMVRTRTVGQGLANIWLIKVLFYDKNGRAIQQQGNNQLNNSVADITTNVADFTGVVQVSKVTKVAASITTSVLTNFTYDQVYRKISIDQSYNGATAIRIADYEYNELGQLVTKRLKKVNSGTTPDNITLSTGNSVTSGNTSNIIAQHSITITPDFVAAEGSTFTAKILPSHLQSVDYRYTVRGQLKNINNAKLIDDGDTNSDDNDLFGMELLYNETDSNLGNTASFTGRQSAVRWMTMDDNGNKTNERAYKYNYDVLNRINASNYAERAATSTSTFNLNASGFDESGITMMTMAIYLRCNETLQVLVPHQIYKWTILTIVMIVITPTS